MVPCTRRFAVLATTVILVAGACTPGPGRPPGAAPLDQSAPADTAPTDLAQLPADPAPGTDPTAPAPTPEADVVPDGPGDVLAGIRIEPEGPRDGYDRDLFSHWDDLDGNGCDTRCELLAENELADGSWPSLWDGATVVERRDIHADHVVALAEAWDSGASAFDAQERMLFANDKANLVLASASSNMSKSDRDAAEWFPSDPASNCAWVTITIDTKRRWDLSVDPAEADALRNLATTCPPA